MQKAISPEDLHKRYLRRPTIKDRNALIELHYGFLVTRAQRQKTDTFSIDEAISAGLPGLIEAIRRYRPDRGKFTTFAHWWIMKFILAEKAKAKNVVSIPVSVLRKNRKIRMLRERGHTNLEIQQILQLTPSEFREYDGLHEFPTGSPSLERGQPSTRQSIAGSLPMGQSPAEALEGSEGGLSRGLKNLEDAMGQLEPREREILMARHKTPPVPYSRLCQKYGITSEGVRKIFLSAMEKLKDILPYTPINEKVD